MRLRKRERLDTTLRFQATAALKERLWRLCEERGLLPSQIMREALLRELERLERLDRNKNTNSKTKESDQQ